MGVASQLTTPSSRPWAPSRRSVRGHLGRAGLRTLARMLVAAAVLIGLANMTTPADLPTGPSATPPLNRTQLELMRRYDCSRNGFGDGSDPLSAIIREDGDLRVVSFDRGWQVYTGTRPDALVAVCHEPPR